MSVAGALVAAWGLVETRLFAVRDAVRDVGRRLRWDPDSGAPPVPSTEADVEDAVREAKYAMPRPGRADGPLEASGRETDPLPSAYGVDRIVALSRDPWCLFVYWEVTRATRLAAERTLGAEAAAAREVLRIHDVTAADGRTFVDVEPAPGAASSYVDRTKPAGSYRAEIGLRTPAGRFVPLARSAVIATPAAQVSADTAVTWVDAPDPRSAH